jgi:peptidoglycan/LPS O-acetylase OafA/YrhL
VPVLVLGLAAARRWPEMASPLGVALCTALVLGAWLLARFVDPPTRKRLAAIARPGRPRDA